MDILELGAIGELVGGVAVIATLGYLAIQVRQSIKTARSATYQAAVSSTAEWTRCVGSDATLALLIHRGYVEPTSLSDEERIQFAYLLTSLVRNFENIHYQHENGSLDAQNWTSWAGRILGVLTSPGGQAWWAEERSAFSGAFQEFVSRASGQAVPLRRVSLSGSDQGR